MSYEEAQEKIKVGAKYRHYKGGIYTVAQIGMFTEVGYDWVVIYHNDNNQYFARPVESWLETVRKLRFEEIRED